MNFERPGWLGSHPATLRRRVKWGECDPAGVVYTPRFADYVAEALHAFLEGLLEGPLQKKLAELDLGTPAKAMQFVFHRSLWPEQEFDIEVRGGEIRTRSFDLDFHARDLEGRPVFDTRLSAVCVFHRVRESRPIPQALRERLDAYRAHFPAPLALAQGTGAKAAGMAE